MDEEAGPRILRSLDGESDGCAENQIDEEIPWVEHDMKTGPQQTVYEPRPFAIYLLLTGEDVPAPPTLFGHDLDDDQQSECWIRNAEPVFNEDE